MNAMSLLNQIMQQATGGQPIPPKLAGECIW